MPAQTATYAIPYPVGTDRVMDGDNAMQAIAERVEAVWQFFYTEVTVLAGASFRSANITWPTAYSAAPTVVCQVATKTGSTAGYFANAYAVTATGCQVRVDKAIGAAPGANTVVGIGMLVGLTKTVLANVPN